VAEKSGGDRASKPDSRGLTLCSPVHVSNVSTATTTVDVNNPKLFGEDKSLFTDFFLCDLSVGEPEDSAL